MKLDIDDAFEEPKLELTPMIDVVFLLLVFFMVATTFLDPEREIEMDLPQAQSGETVEEEQDELVINVQSDGTVYLGTEALDHDALSERLSRVAARDPETPVTIRGDREARHQDIVRVMDACGLAGLSQMALGTLQEG